MVGVRRPFGTLERKPLEYDRTHATYAGAVLIIEGVAMVFWDCSPTDVRSSTSRGCCSLPIGRLQRHRAARGRSQPPQGIAWRPPTGRNHPAPEKD